MKLTLPRSAQNPITILGAMMVAAGIAIFVFLFIVFSIFEISGPYIGLVLFMIIPIPIVLGLLLIPFGMVYKIKRFSYSIDRVLPIINPNIKSHRNAIIVFFVGTSLFFFLAAFGTYNAYHYTESVEFCGKLCHEAMRPEYVTYSNSPHARVLCAECHVGTGANWYVKSKMSGLYQVYAVLADIVPRPIPTPIHNLRPARETCESCHWPEKFFQAQQIVKRHFVADENNSPWTIHFLMSIGGGTQLPGHQVGSHWHVHPDNQIEYIASDQKQQNIPWIKWTDKNTGREIIFHSEDEPLEQGQIDTLETRIMDCMDCHNRPSHVFLSPNSAIDTEMSTDRVDRTLPYIKAKGIEALVGEYSSNEEAHSQIAEDISSFYEEEYPDLAQKRSKDIEASIKQIQTIYDKNFFPEMNVRWDKYHDNIGHLEFPGCFRCHDGKHVTDEGKPISHECDGCHLIMAQGTNADSVATLSREALEFEHPVDIDEAWRDTGCFECHTGESP